MPSRDRIGIEALHFLAGHFTVRKRPGKSRRLCGFFDREAWGGEINIGRGGVCCV